MCVTLTGSGSGGATMLKEGSEIADLLMRATSTVLVMPVSYDDCRLTPAPETSRAGSRPLPGQHWRKKHKTYCSTPTSMCSVGPRRKLVAPNTKLACLILEAETVVPHEEYFRAGIVTDFSTPYYGAEGMSVIGRCSSLLLCANTSMLEMHRMAATKP